jgi:drug/metabolite transporter (DMT)-like permease
MIRSTNGGLFMPAEVIGYILVLSATIFWALSGVISKFFFNQAVSPFVVMEFKLTCASFLLLIYLRQKHPEALNLPRDDIKRFLILGVFGVAGIQLTYLYTISQLNVATAIFLQYLAPAIIAIYAVLRHQESMRLPWAIALALACVGSALMISNQILPGDVWPWQGVLTGFASAGAFAFYTVYSRSLLRKYGSWTVLTYGFLFGAIPFWLIMPLWTIWTHHYGWLVWLFFVYTAVFATIIPYGLFLKGLNYIKASRATLACTIEPALAAILAYLILGERLSQWQIVGCALIFLSLLILQIERKPAH